ncbi:MAG: prepilin-type N-terminal cleavage/methylation domain-containing protein [Chthoniobacteraceae bacterium]
MSPSSQRCNAERFDTGFSLIELLVVMGIVVVLLVLVVPSVNSIKSNEFAKAMYDIASTLEMARAYAVANHTYTWVGIGEFDETVSPGATPQVSGTGRVAIAVVASRDGTRGYDVLNTSLSSPPWSDVKGAMMIPVGKALYFDNLHMAPSQDSIPNSGNLARPILTSGSYILGNTASSYCVTQFAWPLGVAVTNSSSAKYVFQKVINFDSSGVARIQFGNNLDEITTYIEIGLLPIRGNRKSTSGNMAAILINGMTGRTRLYRP